VKLTRLLADITRVLAWFDPEPSALDQGVLAEHPPSGAGAEPRTHSGLACLPTNRDSVALCVQSTPRTGAASYASGERRSRQGGQGGGSVNWKPADEGHEAAAGEWTAGDRVKARANAIKVRTGSRGIVVGFSSVGGHPLVDFAGSGLVLIRAEHLERDDDAPPETRSPNGPRSSGTTRLSDTPRLPSVAVAPLPPPPDWFERPPQPQVCNRTVCTSEQWEENIAP
jgi:hypothetical protein